MIAITGASGHLGTLTIQELLGHGVKPSEITALVRNPAKAEDLNAKGINVRIADYDRPGSLIEALMGIKKLLLISSSEVGKRIEQHRAVINAAKETGVDFLAYTSILAADKSPLSLAHEHRETEKMIKASGISHVLLRNGWYTENYLMGIPHALESGIIYGCAGNAKFSTAIRSDFAKAAAKVLTSEGHEGKTYELAGDQSFTLTELANEISSISGRPVSYNNLTQEQYSKLLADIGLPPGFATILAETEILAQEGWLENNSHDLSKLIGKETVSLREAIKSLS